MEATRSLLTFTAGWRNAADIWQQKGRPIEGPAFSKEDAKLQ